MTDEISVETKNLTKTYRIGKIVVNALRGVDFKLKKGEFASIIGPSGSGKSTMLHLIGALDRPTEGKVFIEGVDISTRNDRQLARLRNTRIGFVFQAYNLINRMDVLTNVMLPMIVQGHSRSKRRARAKRLLEAVGLGDKLNRRPMELSGGEQQRVGIARALINDPALVLGDEITGNLDTKTAKEVMDILRSSNQEFGTTYLIITHDLEVASLTDRIIQLRDGKVVGEKISPMGVVVDKPKEDIDIIH